MIRIVTDLGVKAARILAKFENDEREVRIHSVSKPRPDGQREYHFRRAG